MSEFGLTLGAEFGLNLVRPLSDFDEFGLHRSQFGLSFGLNLGLSAARFSKILAWSELGALAGLWRRLAKTTYENPNFDICNPNKKGHRKNYIYYMDLQSKRLVIIPRHSKTIF